MNLRLAILTWIHYQNYGSILQAYALSNYLKKFENDVSFINYKPITQHSKSLIEIFGYKGIKLRKIFKNILYRKKEFNEGIIDRKNIFIDFVKTEFNLTEECSTNSQLEKLSEYFDFFICGSDQIWSPLNFDEKFYLNFVKDQSKKIAYAPSIGVSKINNKNIKDIMKQEISKFKYLSIREKEGQNIIKELTGKEAELVVDPTLLFSKMEWIKFSEKDRYNNKNKYLLVYFLGERSFYYEYINNIAKVYDLKVVIIPTKVSDLKDDFEIVQDITPYKFVSIFNNASCVCTDSFHGTIFSLTFGKPFLVFERFKEHDIKNENSRLKSILIISNQEERFVGKYNEKFLHLLSKTPSYGQLDDLIDKSKLFIKKSLDKHITN